MQRGIRQEVSRLFSHQNAYQEPVGSANQQNMHVEHVHSIRGPLSSRPFARDIPMPPPNPELCVPPLPPLSPVLQPPLQPAGDTARASARQCEQQPICPNSSERLLEQAIMAYIEQRHRELGVNLGAQPLQNQPAERQPDVVPAIRSRELSTYDRGLLTEVIIILATLGLIAESFLKIATFTDRAVLGLPGAQFFVGIICIGMFFIYDKPSEGEPQNRAWFRKWLSRTLTKFGIYLLITSIISLGLNIAIVGIEDLRVEQREGEIVTVANRVNPILLAINYVFIIACAIIIPFIRPILKRIDLFYSQDLSSSLQAQITDLNQQLTQAERRLLVAQHETQNVRDQLFYEILRLRTELQRQSHDLVPAQRQGPRAPAVLHAYQQYSSRPVPRSPSQENRTARSGL